MKIYFDGGAAPNPGLRHCAINIDGEEMIENNLGYGSNNSAEWLALLWALETAQSRGVRSVEIIGDSMLVVMQSTGKWKIKQTDFLPFKAEADRLIKWFDCCTITHTRRENNVAGHQIEAHLKKR